MYSLRGIFSEGLGQQYGYHEAVEKQMNFHVFLSKNVIIEMLFTFCFMLGNILNNNIYVLIVVQGKINFLTIFFRVKW